MSFFSLKQFTTKDIIEKKERVSLIVSYSFQSFFAFFQDATFQHIDRRTRSILRQGSLNFIATSSLTCNKQGRIVLLGCNKSNTHFCAVLDVFNDYNLFCSQLSNGRPQLTTKFYCYDCISSQGKDELYLITVFKNVQNGIAISVFDLYKNIWSEQMLALNSRFLQCHFIQTQLCNKKYLEQRDINCYTFALVAVGERFDSVNYTKIKFHHENIQQTLVLKLKFIITREIKLKQHFVVIAGYQSHENNLYLVGNSKTEVHYHQFTCFQPTSLLLNTQLLDAGQPQDASVNPITLSSEQKAVQLSSTFLIRNFLGIYQGNLFFLLSRNGRKSVIAKFNLHNQQIMLQIQIVRASKFELSSMKDCFCSYESLCQQFFQKIKSAPSIINFNLLRLSSKQTEYRKLIRVRFPQLSAYMCDRILEILQ